ncbi:MAG: TSUP family transporter [Reyranellaceae bacterium]
MASLGFAAMLFAAVLGTSFLSGIFGMAGGLILMGFLLAVLPVASAMALHAITQMASNGWRAVLWRQHIHWRVFGWTVVGKLIALAGFALVQWVPSTATAYIVLGLVPFLVRPLPERLAPNVLKPGMPVLCGFIVQGLQLTCGVSGPTLDIFYVRTGLDRRVIVATKAATQVVGHFIKLAYFTLLAMAAVKVELELWLYAMAIVTAITGTTLARRVLDAMTDRTFMVWSQRIILALGAVYLCWGVWLSASA